MNPNIDTAAQTSQRLNDAILATLHEAFLVLDAQHRVARANPPFYWLFQVEAADTEGRSLFALGNGQWDVPALRQLLGEVLPRDTVFRDFEVIHDFPRLGPRTMRVKGRRLGEAETGREPLILLGIEDITEQRRAEAALAQTRRRFELFANKAPLVIYPCRIDGDYGATYVSPGVLAQTGYPPEAYKPPPPSGPIISTPTTVRGCPRN